MKQLVFAANHKQFNTLRLALQLARALQDNGQSVVLGTLRGKLPAACEFATLELAPTAAVKTWAGALKKAEVQKVISLGSVPLCEAAALAKLPYVYAEPENFKEEKPVKNKKAILKNAQKVIVLTDSTKALDKKRYGSNAVRVKNPAVWVAHGTGLWPSTFKKANNIVAAGTKADGLTHMLQVWADLAPLHPTWHLTLCVPSTDRVALQKIITKYNLQSSTELYVQPDRRPLLAYADIYVHPATGANGLEDLLDAMASTLPVIAVQNAATQALITPQVDGTLLPQLEQTALRTALDELMVDWGKRVGLALQAQKMKDRFPFEVFASFFEEV